MSETIIKAKKGHRILMLNNRPSHHGDLFHVIDVIAWAINGHDLPVPITPFGRYDVKAGYVLGAVGSGADCLGMPSGDRLNTDSDAYNYLRSLGQ